MSDRLTQDDEGKELDWNNYHVGVVVDVTSGTATVDPDWGNVSEELADALDWEESPYTVEESDVVEVANDQVRLRDNLL